MISSTKAHLTERFQYETAEELYKERGDINKQLEEELNLRIAKLVAKGWLARKPKGEYWKLLMHIKYNIVYADLDCLAINTGGEGSGKSNLDLATGAILDETFCPENLGGRIFYSYSDIDDFYEYEPQYSFGFVDEGSLFSARDYMNTDSRALLNTLMVAREGMNRFIMVNIPYFGELDTFLRNQRLRFVIRCRMIRNAKLLTMDKGYFNFFTKETSQKIGKDYQGKLKFPRPDSSGYCPRIMGDLWRAYKEISGPRKGQIRREQRERVDRKKEKENR